jgi:hypothetical protein
MLLDTLRSDIEVIRPSIEERKETEDRTDFDRMTDDTISIITDNNNPGKLSEMGSAPPDIN